MGEGGVAIVLIGPTGSGKSAVALSLAKKIDGEIISCDSMQVYRGMDIGTAKPTRDEQKRVPHHLIDLFTPRQQCTTFRHQKLALRAIKQVLKRKRTPILVGGSGFYVKTILEGASLHPGKNSSIRNKLEICSKKDGTSKLYQRLKSIDPKRARAIHANDRHRIIRALEIWEVSKKKPSALRNSKGLNSLGVQTRIYGLLRDRTELYHRIEQRVDTMIKMGWLDEVARLRKKRCSQTALAAIGYGEFSEYLRQRTSLAEAILEVKKRTRHLAKKQMTWFRSDHSIQWIPIRGDHFVQITVRQILRNQRR
jgi:tRNA dimethylallyltransferase